MKSLKKMLKYQTLSHLLEESYKKYSTVAKASNVFLTNGDIVTF